MAETARLAERLRFDLTRDLGYRYPGSEDGTADRRLAETCRARFGERYDGTPQRREAERRLEEELRVIAKLGLSGFFLLHRDLLELARDVAVEVRGPDSARALLPPGRGRGSSVSSVVCYLTGLSHVDPVKAGLFLGRFLNDEITEAPDIDLDFPRDVRERLIPRIHERYGQERSALVAAFPTYRSRGAVRDLGKALGLPQGEIERVARAVSPYATYEPRETPSDPTRRPATAPIPRPASAPTSPRRSASARAGSERWRVLASLMEHAYGLPRHPSQHPGGMVLSTRPLIDLCPVVPAAMEGRQIAQWDKDSCADAGFLKIDLLGLGMLSAVERCVEEIGADARRADRPLADRPRRRGGLPADPRGGDDRRLPDREPRADADAAALAAREPRRPDRAGGARAARADPGRRRPSLPRAQEGAARGPGLRRPLRAPLAGADPLRHARRDRLPGPGDPGGDGARRLQRRRGRGAAAGDEPQALRRGAARLPRPLRRGRGRQRASTLEVAERVFDQIKGFSGFGFPKSHAAAFGLLAYQSTWLRVHYGPEFLCALLNEQPMGFYPPDALVHEAQRRGIEVRGPDVNASAVRVRGGGRRRAGACGSGSATSRA